MEIIFLLILFGVCLSYIILLAKCNSDYCWTLDQAIQLSFHEQVFPSIIMQV